MLEFFIAVVTLVIGLSVGWIFFRNRSRQLIQQTRQTVAQQFAEVRRTAALILRDMDAQARQEAEQLRQASAIVEKQAAEENALLEESITKQEKRNERHEEEAKLREADMEQRENALKQHQEDIRLHRQTAKEHGQLYQIRLEEIAEETIQQVKERLAETWVEETRAQCADRLRNLESSSNEEFMRQAKRIMGISLGRYGCKLLTERPTSSVTLTKDQANKLTAHPDSLQLMEELTSVHLAFAENNEALRLESGDGVARELARRVVNRFLVEERIRDLTRLIRAIHADLEREILDYGKEAFRRLDLEPAHPELLKLLGRLMYRTSYTQNQWEHVIESAFLAGMMAAELGMDVRLARRATLLHDIGKALTHEVEGSHALIGAEYARNYGESEIIANAIGAHHGDEPPQTPYVHLVVAADAMSGARPGARREMVETYVDRITELERIAGQFGGVMTVHAVQAGRELRVHVDDLQINDIRAAQLAEEIAQKISQEVVFPGQIRVTVIREFRAVEYAI